MELNDLSYKQLHMTPRQLATSLTRAASKEGRELSREDALKIARDLLKLPERTGEIFRRNKARQWKPKAPPPVLEVGTNPPSPLPVPEVVSVISDDSEWGRFEIPEWTR